MTRLFRSVAVLLFAAASVLIAGAPARAGGWAATLLDPLPDRLEPDTAYTVGYWVMQHGFHPYEGELGATALRLTDAQGRTTAYAGTPLPEAGHYAAAVVLGRGTWRLSSTQGLFGEYQIGEVTVPGGLTLKPAETPADLSIPADNARHWDAVRPPLPTGPAPAARSTAPAAPAPAAAGDPGPPRSGPLLPLAGGAIVVAGLALLFGRRIRADRAIRSSGSR
jgi:hypothetical protein